MGVIPEQAGIQKPFHALKFQGTGIHGYTVVASANKKTPPPGGVFFRFITDLDLMASVTGRATALPLLRRSFTQDQANHFLFRQPVFATGG